MQERNTEDLVTTLEFLIKSLKTDLDASLIDGAKSMIWQQVVWSLVNYVYKEQAAHVFEDVEQRIKQIVQEHPDRDTNAIIQDALADFRLEAREILNTLK